MKRCLSSFVFYCTIFCCVPTTVSDPVTSNCKTIDAAFSLPGEGPTFFLSGDEFIEYNLGYGSEANVGPITRLGLDGALESIDAIYSDDNDSLYVLKGCNYYRYRLVQQRRPRLVLNEQGLLQDLGLPCNVNAAMFWGRDTLAFSGCEVWKMNPTSSIFEQDGSLTNLNLPCDLDAAVTWSGAGAIFIKGTSFWKFDGSMQGPFSTDDLHLCSWRLCGEADWMEERRTGGGLRCNGDSRFCDLRLNQVTLAGLHNAGAGFAGGFGFLNCWMRNHARSITEQLELGIRHLDIDPCWHTCGFLGTCHVFMCGGSICSIIKQVRNFLKDHRDDVITINFNHEIKDPEKVFKALNRHLKVVNLTSSRCNVRQYRPLVEVSVIPESTGSCIDTTARACRPYLHHSLRACQPYRFQHGNSPNVLLVDYPERYPNDTSGVFHAVFHQNLRNVYQHRRDSCLVKLDAAVWIPGTGTALFFVGRKLVVYSQEDQAQVSDRNIGIPEIDNIDAAYYDSASSTVTIIKGCLMWQLDGTSYDLLTTQGTQRSNCQPVDAVVAQWNGQHLVFQACEVKPDNNTPIPLSDWGLPCYLDAAMTWADQLYLFKGNSYWTYRGEGEVATLAGYTLDWTIDAIQCQ